MHYLQVKSISCNRGDRVLFKDLSFELSEGDIMHIIGPNGVGKSSLLKILTGVRQPDAGEIIWQGKSIIGHYAEYYHDLLYIGHQSGVKQNLTVWENLKLSWRGLPHLNTHIEEALDEMGLMTHKDQLASSLSKGQQQRIALTRLLVEEAKFWILDEPFSNIDDDGFEAIQHLMVDHQQKGGVLIFTSHRPLAHTRLRVQQLPLETYQVIE